MFKMWSHVRWCVVLLVILFLVFLSTLLYSCTKDNESIVVTTENGQIRGYPMETLLGKRQFYSFKGIPFAKAPIGERRFKAPEKMEPWHDILDANEYGNICVQIKSGSQDLVGDENCLFSNIFTPDVTPSNKFPVVFYIHGGGYTKNDATMNGPDILLDENIVLVTIQYRLGPFGFLALDDPEYSGNQGMKDQLIALEWVSQNILHFGGDKNQITLWGHSAGSGSANFLALAPRARGIFRRVIMTGGSAAHQMANQQTKKIRSSLSELLNVNENDLNKTRILDWFLNSNAHEIMNLLRSNGSDSKEKSTSLIWAPVIENMNAKHPFLQQNPDALNNQINDIDVLIGHSSGEYQSFIKEELANPELLKIFNEHFEFDVPLAGMTTNRSAQEYPAYIREIRHFYFGNREVNSSTMNEYTQLLSDALFTYGIYTTAIEIAKRPFGPTFYFEFDVDAGLNRYRRVSNARALGVRGAAHTEDLSYLFKTPGIPDDVYVNLKPDSDEVRIIHMLRTFFINFIRFGNPTPSGAPVKLGTFSENAQNYISLRNDGLVLGVNPHKEAFHFWSHLLRKYVSIFYSDA